MKKYRKPVTKRIELKDELLFNVNGSVGDSGTSLNFSNRNSIVTDDEYLGNEISYNKGIFRSTEENCDDATIVNHY